MRLSQSAKGKLTFWPLDPVWSPCKRVESNDSTVLPKFDPVWSPQIQPNAEPKLELSRVTKWSTVFPKFEPVWSPQMSEIRSAKLVIIQPNAVPKQKLSRLTKWSPIIILALPLLLRKYCSVPLESKCVLPCYLSAQKNRVFKGMLVAQSRENRCRNVCFVHSKQSHRRKRNKEPSRIPKTKLVRLYYHRKKRKHLKILLKQKVPMSSELHYFFKKSKVTFWITRYSVESCFCQYFYKTTARTFNSNKRDISNKSIVARKQFVIPFLSGGMNPTISQSNQIDTAESSYDRLINRLLQKGLQPFDVGGCGDCFFRSVSHQYYGSPDFHIEIKQAGVKYLQEHPELFVESVSEHSW